MKYKRIVKGKFVDRPNRFIAHVEVEGRIETVHVKNTGRCKEILLPGTEVILEVSDNPDRKTAFDLVTAWKESVGWINIDSQAPNKIAREWLEDKGYDYIRAEYTYGQSRIDFYMEKDGQKYLMEVKGCTQEIDGKGYFPDAPTDRGVKHLNELSKAVEDGYQAYLAFVIQMNGIKEVFPNIEIHPEFGDALERARNAGVQVIFICCDVSEQEVNFEI